MNTCFICDSKSSHYCNWEKFEYVKCDGCGLVYLKENPTEEDIYTAYDGGKWKNFRRKLVSPFSKLEQYSIYEEKMESAAELMDIVKDNIGENNSKMLDIGCNKGFLLTEGINRGFIPYGIEIVPVLMDQFKRKYKQFRDNIYSENFSSVSIKFSDNYFDLITAIDVIEHLQNPTHDFESIYRMLKKGGVFLVQTPDCQSSEAEEEKEKWGALKAYEHLILFDKSNFNTLIKKIGFSKVDYFEPVDKNIGNMLAVISK